MINTNQLNRGSEWGKWDLHIHTPASFFWKGGKQLKEMDDTEKGQAMKSFIESVNNSDVAVFCVMDYWTFDWCIELKKYIKSHPDELKKTVFTGMELRVECPVDYRLNIHVLLSDLLTEQQLNDFKSALQIRIGKKNKNLSNEALSELAKSLGIDKAKTHGYGYPSSLSDDQLLELGSKTAEITKDSIIEAFKHIPEESGYIVLPYDTSDGLLNLDWSKHPQDDNFFMQMASIFESRDTRNIDLFKGKRTEDNKEFFENFFKTLGNRPKPCVSGSDAHTFADYGKYPSDKITWIKANPTYEGLKQITYEPDERVKIQEVNPSFEYNKPYFNELIIEDEIGIFQDSKDQVYFLKTILPLNKNLVTIIGGRGTGKSMLVDYWAGIFKNHRALDAKYSESVNFKLKYAKDNILEPSEENYLGGSENYLDYIYIPQRRLKEVSEKNKIGDEVKKLLKIEDLFFSLEVDEEIQTALNAVDELCDWFSKEDEEGRKLNSREFVKNLKKRNEELLKSITTAANKKKLETYTANISETKELESKIVDLDALIIKITETQSTLNESIDAINTQLPEKDGYKKVSSLNFKNQLDTLADNKGKILKLKQDKENQNQTIKSDFEKEGFTGDLSSLLENAETYQSQIKWADKQLELILKKETALEKALKDRDALGAKIKAEYERQKSEIDKAWLGILDKHGDKNTELIKKILLKEGKIAVAGEIVFDEQAFYQKLLNVVDRRTFRDIQALKTKFKISTFEEWVNFVSTDLKEFLNGKSAERFDGVRTLFFGLKERGEYLRTVPKTTYDGKRLDRLSVGQRGTVYLCLKLATDAFSKPIVFDQPEDDLDNEFIMNELIDIFKELKKYRQIVIVTHNANLVVNADAEQVIIANNTDEKLRYESGALENPSIITSVCVVLEGGKEAFEKRKNKYSFNYH